MRKIVWAWLVALLLVAAPARAQVAVTGFGGTTLDPKPTFAGYVDVGSRVTYEGWFQVTDGAVVGEGGDLIVIPKHVGFVVGGDNAGLHVGAAVTLLGVQVRVMKHQTGAWQGVVSYNWTVTPRTYVQAWAQPATNGSAYFMGVGYTFKK